MTFIRWFGVVAFAVAASLSVIAQTADRALNSNPQRAHAVLRAFSQPTFPEQGKIANVAGEVKVIVMVYPDGKSDAHIEVGIPLLNQAALDSAKQSQFVCDGCNEPSQYVLVYSFERTNDGDCCNNALRSPVHVNQMQPSVDEQGRPETRVVVSTAHFCICDDNGYGGTRIRAPKCLYFWKCAWKK